MGRDIARRKLRPQQLELSVRPAHALSGTRNLCCLRKMKRVVEQNAPNAHLPLQVALPAPRRG